MPDTYTTNGKSQTSAQILVDLYDNTIPRRQPSTTFNFSKAREMRLHPSIRLGRAFSIAPIIEAGWSIEGDETQTVWLEEQLLHHRTELLRTALLGEIDFGWKAYELIYTADGGLDKIKPLKNDITWARRDRFTDEFVGLKVIDLYDGRIVYIDAIHTLFISCDEEGLGGYGEAALAAIEGVYDDWIDAAAVAAKVDRRNAGGIWKLDYFPIKHLVDGVETEAEVIAADVLKAIKGGGAVAVPNAPQMIGDKPVSSFDIKHISPQAAQGDIISRLKYLDAMMFRGLVIPERVLSEGTFGTKAESESMTDTALLCLQLKHEQLTEYINRYVVERLLTIQFGKPDAKLCALPLTDQKTAFYRDAFKQMLADPAIGPEILDHSDISTICEAVGWPLVDDGPIQVQPPQPVVVQPPQLPPGQPPQPPAQ